MKKSLTILLIFSVLLVTCKNHVFDNPVDPESDDYSGVESVDLDGDGVGSYEDVDEIAIVGPVDGIVISNTASPVLTIQLLNPEVITAYHVQISTGSGFASDIVLDDITLTSNLFTVPAGTLVNNTTYFWRAKAFDGTKWSDEWSTSGTFVIDIEIGIPMFPSPADTNSIGDATPVLNWEDITGATGYHIQINEVSDFTGTAVADIDTLAVSEFPLVNALENYSTYYWRVKIKDSGDLWGDWSNTWSFTVDVSLDVAANPNPSNTSSIIDTTPLLNWGDVTGVSSYEIEISLDSNFSNILETDNGFTLSQYQVATLLSDNTTYYWRVRIYNEDDIAGAWSNWSFTVNIDEPSNPLPSSGGPTIDTTPLLDWDNVTDALNYEIEISTVSNFSSILETSSGFTLSQHQISTILSNNTTYYWRVRVQNEDSVNGDWSTWSFTVDMEEPKSPIPMSGGSIIDTTPILDWEDITGISSYKIEISTVSNFSSILETASSFALSQYQMTTILSNNATYYWRVRVLNEDLVDGDWSTWNFTVSWNVGWSGIIPSNGVSTTDTTPLLEWVDVLEADFYQLRYANSSSGLDTATIYDLSVSEYLISVVQALESNVYWQVLAVNEDGVNSDWSSVWILEVREPVIGDNYGGGIVFYLDGAGGGFIASESDQGTNNLWGGYGTDINGANGTSIGAGAGNTIAIVSAFGENEPNTNSSNYVAKLCDDLVLNGYEDWFLPSKEELNLMHGQKGVIGGFSDDYYWSSSQDGPNGAWTQRFISGYLVVNGKAYNCSVRAIRAF